MASLIKILHKINRLGAIKRKKNFLAKRFRSKFHLWIMRRVNAFLPRTVSNLVCGSLLFTSYLPRNVEWSAQDFMFAEARNAYVSSSSFPWGFLKLLFSSVQFSSVAQSCPTLWDPMNRSTPGLPVHHQLPEFTQTHVHQVSDAIQPSHPLSSPSPPAPNPSQHQSLFQRVNSSHEVAKVLELQL